MGASLLLTLTRVFVVYSDIYELDHDDPSKPLHRLTNGPEPLKAMVEKSKTIEKPLIAMVRQPKNIQWWWSPQKPLEICNGLFKTIEIYNYCKSKCWETFSLLYCVIFTLWNDVRSQYIWSISNGLYGSWFTWYAKNLCFVVNWF